MCACECVCVSELLKRNYTFWVSWSANLVAGAAACRLSPLSPYRSTLASSHCVGDLQNWPTALLNPQVSPFLTLTNTHTHSYTPTHTHMSLATTLSAVGTAGPSSSSFYSFHLLPCVFLFHSHNSRSSRSCWEGIYTKEDICDPEMFRTSFFIVLYSHCLIGISIKLAIQPFS